jgi:hypothetical protein
VDTSQALAAAVIRASSAAVMEVRLPNCGCVSTWRTINAGFSLQTVVAVRGSYSLAPRMMAETLGRPDGNAVSS